MAHRIEVDELTDEQLIALTKNILYWAGVHPKDFTFKNFPQHEMLGGIRMSLRQVAIKWQT